MDIVIAGDWPANEKSLCRIKDIVEKEIFYTQTDMLRERQSIQKLLLQIRH